MRFPNSLTFKIEGIVIAIEVLALAAMGFYYDNRFREQVDRRVVQNVQAPGRLMERGLLRYDAVADQTIMRQLVGEELVDGMVVGVNGNVFHALNPDDLGKDVAAIPGINSNWFEPTVTQAIVEKVVEGKDTYLVSITPLFAVDGRTPFLFAYIKAQTNEAEAEKMAISWLFIIGVTLSVVLTSAVILVSFQGIILTRLKDLLAVVRRVEAGDLTARVRESPLPDEIGILQNGVNSMAAQLEETIGTLEQRMAELKGMSQALRESEENYRGIFENAVEGIYQTSFEGRVLSANPAMARILGYDSPDEVVANLTDIRRQLYVHPEDHDDFLSSILNQEAVLGLEYRFYRKDRQTIWVSLNARLVRDEAGEPLFIEGFMTDITERKRTERELQRSNDLLRAIIEAAPTAIIGLDLDGNVQTVWNPAAEKMLGWSAQEVMGRLLPSVPEESQEEFRRFRERIRSGKTLDGVEVRRRRRDGSPVDCSIYASPLRDAEGRITGNVAVLVDITERKRAEEERERLLAQIQEQAHRVQEVVDTVPEGVLLLDSDRRVVLTNPLGQEDLVTLAGAQVGDILTRLGDRPLVELLTSPPKGLWHEVATESRSFQVIARPVEDDATPRGWVLVVRDVTRQYESERRIQQQQRLAAVGQLAAGIAHDFNNIMAVIVLHAQMGARSAALSDRDRGRLATINEQAQHATRLIQQILDFSRRAVLERQPLDLLPLLKEQVQLLERTLPEHIAIRLDYGHGEYTVNADPTRMQQMVMNLAVNARDAMPEGGVLSIALERITIEPGASLPLPELVAGDWIKLGVVDTGVGIPPEVLPHIFEPFYTTKPPDQGSGLGLAQVYGIVAQHEGHIDVETQVGAGTTFTIYLPALEVPPTTPLSPDVSIVPRGKGEVVLVVEDNAALRATLRETLAAWGYQVREAADGVQALALLEELGGTVDLVLSDVVMPVMGGVALVHALRERGWGMPVILLSGYPQKQDLAKLRAHGVSAWLPKPPSMEELAEVVAQALDTD